jgi:hypothetical protein
MRRNEHHKTLASKIQPSVSHAPGIRVNSNVLQLSLVLIRVARFDFCAPKPFPVRPSSRLFLYPDENAAGLVIFVRKLHKKLVRILKLAYKTFVHDIFVAENILDPFSAPIGATLTGFCPLTSVQGGHSGHPLWFPVACVTFVQSARDEKKVSSIIALEKHQEEFFSHYFNLGCQKWAF